MSDTTQEPADGQEPGIEDLQEPSTEKEVDEEPKAERPHDPEPSHQAVGIGVIGGPQSIADELAQEEDELAQEEQE